MKFITLFFKCLFFSTLIIKAKTSLENNNEVDDIVNYVPSTRLQQIENSLPETQQEFIVEGMVKETMTNIFENSMNMNVAKNGMEKLDQNIEYMINGSEALRMISTFSKNFKKWAVSTEAVDIINMLMKTVKNLLSEAGSDTRLEGLKKMLETVSYLLASPEMPEIVNKAGGLVITAVNKPNAPQFVMRFWEEVKDIFDDKDLSTKLKKNFKNLISIMHMIEKNSTSSKHNI